MEIYLFQVLQWAYQRWASNTGTPSMLFQKAPFQNMFFVSVAKLFVFRFHTIYSQIRGSALSAFNLRSTTCTDWLLPSSSVMCFFPPESGLSKKLSKFLWIVIPFFKGWFSDEMFKRHTAVSPVSILKVISKTAPLLTLMFLSDLLEGRFLVAFPYERELKVYSGFPVWQALHNFLSALYLPTPLFQKLK